MRYLVLTLLTASLIIASCSSGTQSGIPLTTPDSIVEASGAFPASLPQDVVQPWEQTTSAGLVIPAGSQLDATGGQRSGSGINLASEFVYGAQFWDNSANSMDSGDILELDASGGKSWGIYRFPLGGASPGAVSVDANLQEHSSGGLSEFWVGVSNYGTGAWDWYGPFTDSHARLSMPVAASLVSGVGSVFVSVVTHDGSRAEVVGVGVNPAAPADTTAPPQVTGLTLEPYSGALELNWNDVLAGDLAGYRVYYRNSFFFDQHTNGVQELPSLQGNTTCMLPGSGKLFVRVAAVDLSGNIGELSEVISAELPVGIPPQLAVSVDSASVLVNDVVEATATGADLYDWDIDGDGVFDIVGDANGTQNIYTGDSGIIRPLVRGTTGGGTAAAHAAISLIVTGNSRPIAMGYADPASGVAPLSVTFTGLANDFDGTIARVAWDFNGDKSYEWSSFTVENPPSQIFNTPGTYNAKYRIWDDNDAWDSDTVTVNVWQTIPPSAGITVDNPEFYLDALTGYDVVLDASGSFDPNGGALTFEFDPLGNGNWVDNASDPVFPHTYQPSDRGLHQASVRVTNGEGAADTSSVAVRSYCYMPTTSPDTQAYGRIRMVQLDGRPYLSWNNNTSADKGTMVQAYEDATGSILGYNSYFHTNTPAFGDNATGMCVGADTNLINMSWYGDNLGWLYVGSWDANTSGWSWSAIYLVAGKGEYVDMETVDGNPAIVFYDSNTNDLIYRRSPFASATGGLWDPEVIIDNDLISTHFDMLVVDGRPAVLFQETTTFNLMYAIADDATGTTWAAPIQVDASANSIGYLCDLALINGNPAFVSRDSTDDVIRYSRSTTADGAADVDWSTDAIIQLDDDYIPEGLDLLEMDGLPLIVASSSKGGERGRLSLVTADDPSGSAWGNQQVVFSSSILRQTFLSAMVIEGHPAVACQSTGSGVQLLYPRL